MPDYQDLLVYRRALELSVRIHAFRFAPRRAPGLAAQVMRSCHSISSNVAEGYDRSPAEFAARLRIAISEARETEHHLEFAQRTQAVIAGDVVWALAEVVEIRKMMFGLLRYVRDKRNTARH